MSRTIKRERWIPSTTTDTVEASDIPAVVYKYGECSAVAYGGRRTRPDWHFRFRRPADRDEYIEKYFANLRGTKEWKAQQERERRQFEHTLKVDDILYYSWGYDQTNIQWYKVVRVISSKSVEVQEIGRTIEPGEGLHPMAGYSLPVPGHTVGEPFTKRVQVGNSCTMPHGCLTLWDGRRKYCSWYH